MNLRCSPGQAGVLGSRPGRAVAGFTLIELMIAVAIVATLAAIAYPNYTGYVQESRRSEAQAVLLEAAGTLERCYTEYNAYNSENCDLAWPASEFYSYSETDSASGTFTVQAVPQGSQSSDDCGADTNTLSLDQTGETSPAACW